ARGPARRSRRPASSAIPSSTLPLSTFPCALLLVAAELLALRRQHAVGKARAALGIEALQQGGAQYRRGHALIDGCLQGPASLARIGHAAGEFLQVRILGQRLGGEVEQ